MKKPVMLMILDGWGINTHQNEKNAIKNAHPENFKRLWDTYPHTTIKAAEEAVGLPKGQMGNSEVGHLNLGAGRVIYQPLVQISKELEDGSVKERKVLMDVITYAKENKKTLHLAGLLSDGGVHSHQEHLFGLLRLAKAEGVEDVEIHAFLDGRDTAPQSALTYIEALEKELKTIGLGRIATLSGRYFSMDRDTNWDRTEKAYNAMVRLEGAKFASAKEAVEASYEVDKTDEFVEVSVIEGAKGIKAGDALINFNFRPDRAKQITKALANKDFKEFTVEDLNLKVATMRQYAADITAGVIFVDAELTNTLGEVVANAGLKQLRTAETEKYAHVTFFFNGGKEDQYTGEERKLVASPKVATYDMKPEMSAKEVTTGVLEALDSKKYDMIILNYANPDMVGHTGVYEAATSAIKTVDECLNKVAEKVLEVDGVLLITADHGNAEKMEDPETHKPFTAHTTNDVPLIMIGNDVSATSLKEGKLADIAPTMLELMEIEKPAEMTGNSLIQKN